MPSADYPEIITQLIDELKRLPGIGNRSAERIAVWLLQNPKAKPESLAKALVQAHENVSACNTCGFFATAEGCTICDDLRRDNTQLCIVEQATDVLPMERAGAFLGRYHCLGGKLSPLDRVAPEDLRIDSLIQRVKNTAEPVEIILALGADVEGEATAHYLAEQLRPYASKMTRIAQGLPAGGGIEHADSLTILRALQGRIGF